MAIVLNDFFNRAAANPIGSPYSTLSSVANAIQIISYGVVEGTVTASSNAVFDSVDTYANDQYCSAQMLGSWANGAVLWLLIRLTNTVSGARMAVAQGATTAGLNFYNGSGFNASSHTWTLNTTAAGNDNYRFQVQGQVYTLYQNGVSCGTYTDGGSTVTAGTVGFGFFTTGVLANSQIINFQAGDFTAQGTIAILQQQQTSSNASATTIAQTVTVSSGSYLGVMVTNDTVGGFDSTLSDGTNTYTRQQDINDATNKQRLVLYTTPNVSSGTYTITATFGGASTGRGIAVVEVGGCAGLLTTMGQLQTSPGTASNGVSTGLSGALASLPNLIWSVVIAEADTTNSTLGTNYTGLGYIWQAISSTQGSQTEFQSYNSNASVAATWTASVNSARISIAGVWTQTLTVTGGALTLMGLG